MKNKHLILNQFYLKLIALFLMSVDHIGVFMQVFYSNNELLLSVANILRIIGRLAFPLFILMLTEGIRHSRNTKLYLLRIGILTTVLMFSQIIIYYYIDKSIQYAYSPLIDLSLCAILLYLLKRKDKFSFLTILPIAYLLLGFITQIVEKSQNITVTFFPFYLRPGYSIMGLLLSLGFYYSLDLAKLFLKDNNLVDDELSVRTVANIINCLFLLLVNLLVFLLALNHNFDIWNASIQTWSICAAVLLLIYNGKRGYNKAWFKYGAYLYFPLHIVIIFIIFYLLCR